MDCLFFSYIRWSESYSICMVQTWINYARTVMYAKCLLIVYIICQRIRLSMLILKRTQPYPLSYSIGF